MRKTNNNQYFINYKDYKVIDKNIAVFYLKLGKLNLNVKQIDKIYFFLAHDLRTFAETNGNFFKPINKCRLYIFAKQSIK